MKLAVVIAGANALPSAFVVFRGFEESMRAAAELGYHGVELALKNAGEIDRGTLSSLLKEMGLGVSSISTGQVFADTGLYFTHPEAEVRKKVIEVFSDIVRLAGEFGGMVNIGRIRGFVPPDRTRGETEALFLDTMRRLAETASDEGVTLVLEPVNRYEINFVNSLDEGAELLKKLDCPNVGLMPDVFHMNIEDARIGESLVRHAPLIRYIHLADSNRWSPGCGHLDFAEVFSALKTSGYDGWAGVEILPHPDPRTAARKAAEYLLPRVEKYNG